MRYINVRPKADAQLNLPHGTEQKRVIKEPKKSEMLRRNGPVLKSVESVLSITFCSTDICASLPFYLFRSNKLSVSSHTSKMADNSFLEEY